MSTWTVIAMSLIIASAACASRQAPLIAPAQAEARPDRGRVSVRSGTLSMRGNDLRSIRSGIEQVAAAVGGRVESWTSRDEDELDMTLRLPEPRLDEAMDRVASLARVVARSLQSHDVTETLVDLEARARNLRALRDRLRSYLEKATDLSEILDVERELARVQSELESLEAKLELLRGNVAMSALTVRVTKRRWWG